MDYVDYKVRTFLTQSAGCADWDNINKQLLRGYENGELNVVWEDNGEPYFFAKNKEVRTNYLGGHKQLDS